ncbi:disulfide-isomerase like protein ERp57, partial [Danaus plexippus plexippus]
MEIDFRESK